MDRGLEVAWFGGCMSRSASGLEFTTDDLHMYS